MSASTGETAARRGWKWAALPWAVAVVFIFFTAPRLDVLRPNVDEGVYIQQARLVRQGEVPYVDFFYHQTPLYLYALAGFGSLGADSLGGYRLFSLLASALTGVLVYLAGRRLQDRSTGLLAQLTFYAAPLQVYSFLALPNALTALLAAAGAFAILLRQGLAWALLAGLGLATAVLVKPLAVPVVLALSLCLVLVRSERRKLPALVVSGLATGLASWVLLHAATDGAFTRVLELQARRYSGKSGFELMAHYADFRDAVNARGATTPTRWNVSEHSRAFLSGGPTNGNFWLLLAAAVSPFLWNRRMPRPLLAGLLLWLLAAVWFSVFVWEPVWDHYFVLYLPPLALSASVTLKASLGSRRWWARALALPLVVGCTVLGHSQRFTDPFWYRQARAIGKLVRGRELFSFNPLIHVVAEARPACGLIDPLNVYGEHAIAALDPGSPLRRFQITAQDLVACLGDETPVVIDDYAFWFLEPPVFAHLERTPDRLIFFGPGARRRFQSTLQGRPAHEKGAKGAPFGDPGTGRTERPSSLKSEHGEAHEQGQGPDVGRLDERIDPENRPSLGVNIDVLAFLEPYGARGLALDRWARGPRQRSELLGRRNLLPQSFGAGLWGDPGAPCIEVMTLGSPVTATSAIWHSLERIDYYPRCLR